MADKIRYKINAEEVTKSKIIDNITSVQMRILNDPVMGKELAKRLQTLALKATRESFGSPAWKAYMLNFASNPDQLKRLMGNDEEFNKDEYKKDALCYIVANSTCGIDTTVTGTGRNLESDMIRALDEGVKDDIEEIVLSSEEKETFEKMAIAASYI